MADNWLWILFIIHIFHHKCWMKNHRNIMEPNVPSWQQQQQPHPLACCSVIPVRLDWPPLCCQSPMASVKQLFIDYHSHHPQKQHTDLVPCVLEQTSWTVTTLHPLTTWFPLFLSIPKWCPLSSSPYHLVTPLGWRLLPHPQVPLHSHSSLLLQ